MIRVNPQTRQPLKTFHRVLYNYLKWKKKRYSDQREQVLKMLYTLSLPISIDTLTKRLGEEHPNIGYATVARHIRFFNDIGWLIVVRKHNRNGYLLKTEAAIEAFEDTEVL